MMPPRFVGCLKRSGIAAILLTNFLGCGLSDYEKRTDEQRKRIQEYDDTNNRLEDPLEMPTIKLGLQEDAKAFWPDFFLRLPKGFGTTAKHKDKMPYNWPFFLRYSCEDPSRHIYIAAAGLAENKDQEDFNNPKYTPLNFRKFMKVAVERLVRQYPWTPSNWNTFPSAEFFISETPAERVGIKQLTPLSGPAPTITYTLIVYAEKKPKVEDPSKFFAYFYEDKPKQICIVVERPGSLPADHPFNKSVEACLGTLDLSSEAANRRTQYLQLRKR